MITIDGQINIDRFQAALEKYIEISSRTPDEVLEGKGRELGLRLFKAFSANKWGGPGKHPGIARAELAARTAAGQGTKVRASLLAIYKTQRGKLDSALRSIGQLHRQAKTRGTLDQISGKVEERAHLRALRANLWQLIIGREMSARQRGIGVLAASFLWYRSRSNNAVGTYYVRNKSGQGLGYVDKGAGYLRIVGLTAGLAVIDARYSIVASVLSDAEANMLQRIADKQAAAYARAFGGVAA